jgi:phage regulator Rha-like protein
MQPFQQRVIDEQIVLNEKLVRLIQFTTTGAYRTQDREIRELLIEQQGAMVAYNSVLADRIRLFKCEHAHYMTDYCEPCGRINGGG